MNIVNLKEQWYNELDTAASTLAGLLSEGENVTEKLLSFTHELYQSMNRGKELFMDNARTFEVAYQPSITSDFEFIIARLIYHYGNILGLGWNILLRKQIDHAAPDIVIKRNQKTIAIVEIKATVSWSQSHYS